MSEPFICLPDTPFWYAYEGAQNQYGLPRVIARLQIALTRYYLAYGITAGVGDISLRHGGRMTGHSSHKDGDRVDVRPIRIDRKPDPVWWCEADKDGKPTQILNKHYDRTATKHLAKYLFAEGARSILFNDPVIIASVPGTAWYEGHHHHLHVRY